jgi:HSP20 family protein
MPRPSHWRREASNAFEVLQRELNRLLEDYLQPSGFRSPDSPPTDLEPSAWSPPIDVFETPEAIFIVAEVPGVDPASIDLAVTGNKLSLRGVKESGDPAEALRPVRERIFGAFHREITLPSEVDVDCVEADASQGVLRIRLPKRNAAKPRIIPIRPS